MNIERESIARSELRTEILSTADLANELLDQNNPAKKRNAILRFFDDMPVRSSTAPLIDHPDSPQVVLTSILDETRIHVESAGVKTHVLRLWSNGTARAWNESDNTIANHPATLEEIKAFKSILENHKKNQIEFHKIR